MKLSKYKVDTKGDTKISPILFSDAFILSSFFVVVNRLLYVTFYLL